jgi:YegS/Rv2252/BmrU family lipid kinase
MRYALIVNPMARSGKTWDQLPKIKGYFKRKGIALDIHTTQKTGDGIHLAREASKHAEVVIAGGGDGTINEVLNGIAGTNAALGIIPLGTTNVLALELNIPIEPIEACRHLTTKTPKLIDIGMINERYFLSWAGIGLHSRIIDDTDRAPLKKFFGAIAYAIAGTKAFFTYSPSRMSINADSKNYSGYFVLVGNIKYYGGRFKVLPKAQSNDGLLDVVIFHQKSVLQNFKYTIAMGLGLHVNYDDVDYFQAKNIRVDSFEKALIHADAEMISTTPATISIKKEFLKIIA